MGDILRASSLRVLGYNLHVMEKDLYLCPTKSIVHCVNIYIKGRKINKSSSPEKKFLMFFFVISPRYLDHTETFVKYSHYPYKNVPLLRRRGAK